MEALNLLAGAIVGGILSPIVSYVKSKMPVELGRIMPVVLAGLNLLVVWALAQYLAPELTLEQMIVISFAGHVAGQTVHSNVKSIQEKRSGSL